MKPLALGRLSLRYYGGESVETFEPLPAGETTGVLFHYEGRWYRRQKRVA